VKIWDSVTGEEKSPLSGHSKNVMSLKFSRDGKTLTSSSTYIINWDYETGQEKFSLFGHSSWVVGLSFTPDGKTFISKSDTIKFWDSETGKDKLTLSGKIADGSYLACTSSFTPDGKSIIYGTGNKKLHIFDWETEQVKMTIDSGHNDHLSSITISPDGNSFITSDSKTIKFWDCETGKEKLTLSSPARCIAFHPDGKTFIISEYTYLDKAYNFIKLLDSETLQEKWKITCPDTANHLSFHPDGKTFLCSMGYNIIKVFDSETGEERVRLLDKRQVTSVEFSPDGKDIALGNDLGEIKVWEGMEDGQYRVIFSFQSIPSQFTITECSFPKIVASLQTKKFILSQYRSKI